MQFGQLSVRWANEHAVLAQRNQVFVVNYRGPISPQVMDATESVQRVILSEHGRTCLMLSIVENGLPLPDEAARQTIIGHFRRVSEQNTAFATALLGDGFWAGAARSILSGFSLVVRAACPNGTFADIPAATRFLATHAGGAIIDAATLANDVDALREAASRGPLTAR